MDISETFFLDSSSSFIIIVAYGYRGENMKTSCLVLLLLVFSFLAAQAIPLTHNPEMLHGTLENGMKYFILQNSVPANRLELRLHVDVGSIVEDEDQLGLAHFTEHMAFNGTKNFSKQAARDYLASIGMGSGHGFTGSTSFDYTKYQLRLPTDNKDQLEQGFLIMADIAHQVSFGPEELELERGVVIEEWRMKQGWGFRYANQFVQHKLRGSRYPDRLTIGKYDVLSTFGRDEILRFYNDWYRPDLQSIIVVGDLPSAEALALVKKYFGVIPAQENPRPHEIYPIPDYTENSALVFTDPDLHFSSIGLNWRADFSPLMSMEDFSSYILLELISTMFSQRMTEYVIQKIPPFSDAGFRFEYALKNYSNCALSASGIPDGKGDEAFHNLITEWERVLRYGFLDSELERAKLRLIRKFEAERDKHGSMASADLADELFEFIRIGHTIMNPQQFLQLAQQLLPEIQIKSVNAMASQFTHDKHYMMWFYGPQKEGILSPTEEQLLSVYAQVIAQNIEPYVDAEINETLMARIPTPGSIKKERILKDSGVKEWILSNGVRVYSKKTDFKADEILFKAKSPGGYSGLPVAQALDAKFLGDYLYLTGVGEHDKASLDRVMSGKIAKIGFDVERFYNHINGSTTPKDMETLFQLIHLYATVPRFDAQSFNVFSARMRPVMEFISNDAKQVFTDSLASLRWQRHPILRNNNLEQLNKLEVSSLQRIHQDSFGNYADFTFLFVGSFDEDILKEYCKTYLATLPVGRKKDKIDAKAFEPFSGHEQVSFRKGSNESAQVVHLTSGYCKIDNEANLARTAMIMVLSKKLFENIRERMSGVYLIYPQSEEIEHSRGKRPAYSLAVTLFCDPNREEELSAAVFATIDSLKAGDYDESYALAVKAQLQKVYEDRFRNNEYWIEIMTRNVYSIRKIDSFLQHPQRLNKIDKKLITDTAKRYLTFDTSHRKLVMLPENK